MRPDRTSATATAGTGAAGSAVLALLVAALIVPATGRAQTASSGEIALRAAPVRLASPDERRALDQDPVWRAFISAHGPWTALWNTRTASPHRAFGRPIPLPGFADDAAAVEVAVRRWIRANPGLFGAPDLEATRVQRVGATWYLSFRQTVAGAPVLFSDWEFRVGSGGLFAFGVDAHRAVPLPPTTRLAVAVARLAARAGLVFDPARDRTEGGDALSLLPVPGENGVEYRPVLETRVVTTEPPHDWRVLVDAGTGEVLWRADQVRTDIAGHVTGDVHPVLPTDPLSPSDLPHLTVTVGGSPVVTDGTGHYTAPAAGTVAVTAALRGLWCATHRTDGVADAAFSTSASDPSIVDIAWTAANSHDAERDAYRSVNVVHDFVKTIDPGLVRIDYPIACNLNINNTCNAYYSPIDTSVNFYRAGGGCPNTATMRDVVYHEYGHGVNNMVYIQSGLPYGMNNNTLHEGMADVLACLLLDDPVVGKGFFGPGTMLRTLDNTARWPEDGSSDPHVAGLILGGAFWDLRRSAGLAVARHLSHFAKYGLPDDPEDGAAMSEYFIETLVADDDDADLSNGTPHFADILAAFNAHGIGSRMFIDILHTPLEDQPTAGPYAVRDTVRWTAGFGGLAGAPVLHYSVDGGPVQDVVMTLQGDPDDYLANVPPLSGSVVSYWVSATDLYGETVTDPPFAPAGAALAAGTHRFLAGPATTLLSYPMEGVDNEGWTTDPTDNAQTGRWIRDKPNGTWVGFAVPVQPDDDHSPNPGFHCWVTGNAGLTEPVGANDVDNGHTTLITPVFDATAAGLVNPAVSYWRWYTNDLGSNPGGDVWRTEISNDDGESWVPVENTPASANRWSRVLFRIADFVTPTALMRMRFIAEDIGLPSLVEAAVDDWSLVAFAPGPVAVGPGAAAGLRVALAPPAPSPSSGPTRLRFTLAAPGETSLRIYDLGGRAVRSLLSGAQDAGEHTIVWDGRDEEGRALAAGTYFLRLVAGGATASRALIVTR